MVDDDVIEQGVYAVAASPDFAAGGVCFAALPAGLVRSTDGGSTWHDAYATLTLDEALATTTVVLSPAFATDRHVFAGVQGGMLRSNDAGQTWSVSMLPTPPPVVTAIALEPGYAGGGLVFAATLQDGVFRSSDGGATWEIWNFGLLDQRVLCLAISPDYARDRTLFAGTETGIYLSTNDGRSWKLLGYPAEHAPVLSLAVSPRYPEDATLFAGSEQAGLFRSTDRGRAWQPVTGEDMAGAVNAIVPAASPAAGLELMILVEGDLYLSRDSGASWAPCVSGAGGEEGLTAFAAPAGLAPGAPLLLGLVTGEVVRTTIE